MCVQINNMCVQNNNRCCNELQAFPSSDCYEITTTVACITDKCHGEVHLK